MRLTPMEQLDGRARSRRRFLALGAGLIGVAALAGARAVGGAVIPAAAPVLRPEPHGARGSSSVCAACGREGHSMLDGACLPCRLRT